jgi:F-box and WD-40 domain protein CDC4
MFSPPHYPPFFFLILALTELQFMLTMLCSTAVNWKCGGRCLHTHHLSVLDPDSGIVTSIALNADWLVAGLANHHIYVFSTHTGSLMHTLVRHELGVWVVGLISHRGVLDSSHPPPSSLNSDGATVGISGIPEVTDGPALLALHNRAPAGA